jgi:hypothetical protein
MAANLQGIHNVGEFFSQHYLDQLLEKDLRELLDVWSEREKAGQGQAPPKRLSTLANPYFKQRALAQEETSPRRRLACAQDFHAHLLEALGYPREPGVVLLESGELVPLVGRIDHDRKPFLWIVEAPFAKAESAATSEEDDSPFHATTLPEQFPHLTGEQHPANDGASVPSSPSTLSWGELFDGPLFHEEETARWVLFLAGSDAFLIDRHKWPQGKYLHFELGTLFQRRETDTLRAVAALLHRDALVPEGGTSLLERLDEASHKHAFAVSTDLKWGVQRSVERIANEALHYRRTVQKRPLFDDSIDPTDLSRECIVYLYRLLFLCYVEARGSELGVVPMAADAYRLGYSLEALRDLEQVPLLTPAAQEGFFLHESLKRLFVLVQQGHLAGTEGDEVATRAADPLQGTFALPGLGSPLFDPRTTPILSSVRLRNAVLQKVLQDLSLSRERAGKARGRISYAQLGINQLGAVYERLLSYTGFFAKTKLYEVRAANELADEDARTYFVPENKIGDYNDDEKVPDAAGRPVVHAKGTFLFRLAGRDREKNASYYTPEVLTQCLTKYTLKVRLGEPLLQPLPGEEPSSAHEAQTRLSADEILNLTLCEPAMGSGAFLNEAISQLAHKYLEKKQAELGQTIPSDQYQREWAKVKYHFAAHQVYGVDLNPLAADLGKISLWLNALVPGAPPPFTEPRIAVGNSLIGARREVFTAEQLGGAGRGRRGAATPWLKALPLKVALGPEGFQPRPEGSVYHFLLADEGMVSYADDRVVRELVPEQAQALRDWRRALCAPLSADEVKHLQALSDCVDELWQEHIADRRDLLRKLRQPVGIWGQSRATPTITAEAPWKTMAECEALTKRLQEPTAAGQRLRVVMDYWCALWFWPLLDAEHAPSRQQWLAEVERLLAGDADALTTSKGTRERSRARVDVVQRQRFFHWELQYAEMFADRGGLDVFLGNPPWLKVEWQEASVLGDLEPVLTLRGLSATQIAKRRASVMTQDAAAQAMYLGELETTQAWCSYLSARTNSPELQGTKANLYKCFLLLVTMRANRMGTCGLLHQPGVFDDPNGGAFRSHLYPKMALAGAFKNELLLFEDVDNHCPYVLSIWTEARVTPPLLVSNLLHPSTLDESLRHSGLGRTPGIKNDAGNWDLRGHRSRVITVDDATLRLFAELYDEPGTPASEARLPIVHSQGILDVLRRFAGAPRRLADFESQYFCTQHWNETIQTRDGTMRPKTCTPRTPSEWIVSGPHFYVGTPFNKTPNDPCRHNKDYTALDLTQIPDDYLPRTNYVPACSATQYRERTPHWHDKPVSEFYRWLCRKMIPPTGERTLASAIMPPGPAHIDGCVSLTFQDLQTLLVFAALTFSIPYDFWIKTTGKTNLRHELLARLPLSRGHDDYLLIHRALRLNCLTANYAKLWSEGATSAMQQDAFAKQDFRLCSWKHLESTWRRESALRTPYERRQALVELDALAALSLGLTEEQLLLIYRLQFPVLQEYERETFYDQRGKIVFTVSKGLSDVGLPRKQWNEIKDAKVGDELPNFAYDAGGAFVPPFDRCDREEDMAQAYRHFANLLGKASTSPAGSVRKTGTTPRPPPAANDVNVTSPKQSARRTGGA